VGTAIRGGGANGLSGGLSGRGEVYYEPKGSKRQYAPNAMINAVEIVVEISKRHLLWVSSSSDAKPRRRGHC
jgi:hypothetical protein